MKIAAVITAAILFIIFMKSHSRHKHPTRAAVVNMLLGVGSLVLFSAVGLSAVNLYTVFAALTLGVPGTALAVLGRLLL